ncbi:putative glucan 1,3-beta-glucosidase [Rosa chinensis]|uniref:Putative glucan 1,3-beta-glucosidase n=1 Tax=Rosa chinensis TaxID=74649 RepID=A0A2P6RQX9_ROSCH|nr:putative glucan 1,3-beta-glucosidase [Rosa chinensis]
MYKYSMLHLYNNWDTYITEDDFKYMSSNGLNAVRILVGWWIAYKGQTRTSPFVRGAGDCLKALDNALTWAKFTVFFEDMCRNTGMKVIIDLHAVEGSQNGNDHNGTRDGSQEWEDKYIDKTVEVIEFLAARLILCHALHAHVYVYHASHLICPRHYYSLYLDKFNGFSVQQNINFIYNQRGSDLTAVINFNGPLTFVGEWIAGWAINGASMQDYQRFAKAQLDVYGRATWMGILVL